MGATGANAAISVASKDYVDTKSASVASTAIATELAEGGSIAAAVADAKSAGTAAQDAVDTLEGTVSTLQSNTESALNARELTVNKLTGDTVADTDLTAEKYMSAHTTSKYVAGQIADALHDGGMISDAVKAEIQTQVQSGGVKNAIDTAVANKADKTQVATDIETAVNAAKTTLEAADTALAGRVTTVEGEIDALQGVDTELTGRIESLEGEVHFTQADADLLYADIATEQTAADAAALAAENKTAIAGVKTTADNALPAATYNQFLTDKSGVLNSGIDSTKVAGYDAVVLAVNNAESGLEKTNEIADAAAAQASSNATAITNINEELVEKITMPAICDKTTCVLTYDTVKKVPAWVPLAEPEISQNGGEGNV